MTVLYFEEIHLPHSIRFVLSHHFVLGISVFNRIIGGNAITMVLFANFVSFLLNVETEALKVRLGKTLYNYKDVPTKLYSLGKKIYTTIT